MCQTQGIESFVLDLKNNQLNESEGYRGKYVIVVKILFLSSSMNYSHDVGYWTKTTTKYEEGIGECEKYHWAAVKYWARDQ